MPDSWIAQFVTFIGHIAWPLTAVIILYMIRHLINQIAAAIAQRIADPRSYFKGMGIEFGSITERIAGEQSDTERKLRHRLGSLPMFRLQLQQWLQQTSPGLSVTPFLDGENYEDLRKKAVLHFQL